jgi:hypothetical protein
MLHPYHSGVEKEEEEEKVIYVTFLFIYTKYNNDLIPPHSN